MTPNCAPAFNTPQDPRLRGDFVPEHYPRANGKDAPPLGAVEQNEVIILAFLAAYYELNRAYAHLLEARGRAPSPERSQAEREALEAIERTLILRDELEDHYAPRGVIVEPIAR